jgi:membrane-associated phospholipid phosphatase
MPNFEVNEFMSTKLYTRKAAELISNLTLPPLLSIPVFLSINYYFLNFKDFLVISFISIFFSALLPLMIIVLWSRKENIDLDMPAKEDRNTPLIIGILTYFIGFLTLMALNAPLLISVLMFCYFSSSIIVYFINKHWKISVHSMGVAGPIAALIFVFGPAAYIVGLILPLVMWSRVYLKRHTVTQVIAGAILGFLLTTTQLFIGYKLN